MLQTTQETVITQLGVNLGDWHFDILQKLFVRLQNEDGKSTK